jgi:hypothetical protein
MDSDIDLIGFSGKKVFIQFERDFVNEEYLFHTFLNEGVIVEKLDEKPKTIMFFPLHIITQIYYVQKNDDAMRTEDT